MVAAHDSKSCIERCEGSSPSSGTKKMAQFFCAGEYMPGACTWGLETSADYFDYPELVEGRKNICRGVQLL